MPYIKQERRQVLDIYAGGAETVGELNYIITKLALRFLGAKPDYVAYNEVIGVLECAKQELYRRAVAPFEDHKCSVNGDVYWEAKSG